MQATPQSKPVATDEIRVPRKKPLASADGKQQKSPSSNKAHSGAAPAVCSSANKSVFSKLESLNVLDSSSDDIRKALDKLREAMPRLDVNALEAYMTHILVLSFQAASETEYLRWTPSTQKHQLDKKRVLDNLPQPEKVVKFADLRISVQGYFSTSFPVAPMRKISEFVYSRLTELGILPESQPGDLQSGNGDLGKRRFHDRDETPSHYSDYRSPNPTTSSHLTEKNHDAGGWKSRLAAPSNSYIARNKESAASSAADRRTTQEDATKNKRPLQWTSRPDDRSRTSTLRGTKLSVSPTSSRRRSSEVGHLGANERKSSESSRAQYRSGGGRQDTEYNHNENSLGSGGSVMECQAPGANSSYSRRIGDVEETGYRGLGVKRVKLDNNAYLATFELDDDDLSDSDGNQNSSNDIQGRNVLTVKHVSFNATTFGSLEAAKAAADAFVFKFDKGTQTDSNSTQGREIGRSSKKIKADTGPLSAAHVATWRTQTAWNPFGHCSSCSCLTSPPDTKLPHHCRTCLCATPHKIPIPARRVFIRNGPDVFGKSFHGVALGQKNWDSWFERLCMQTLETSV
eukprot:Gregarina_sp_Poly_1__4951@NODE_2623_length_1906_cov_98_566069_g1662_i0_p1_GENE_NODE_2623_length_1906_cov_98_566069_g1662_i0NODE_2623_length_1906_cov_98_566069_g1662_i0_p1_ORF_typecomplete_len572_score74_60AP2/PF00847_20/9_2e03AP2/PF00847_20/0_27_NODE_2623_length_1906_cov_98_566069_g1662_i0971812